MCESEREHQRQFRSFVWKAPFMETIQIPAKSVLFSNIGVDFKFLWCVHTGHVEISTRVEITCKVNAKLRIFQRAARQTRLKQHKQRVCRGANITNRRSSSTRELKFPNSGSKNAWVIVVSANQRWAAPLVIVLNYIWLNCIWHDINPFSQIIFSMHDVMFLIVLIGLVISCTSDRVGVSNTWFANEHKCFSYKDIYTYLFIYWLSTSQDI